MVEKLSEILVDYNEDSIEGLEIYSKYIGDSVNAILIIPVGIISTYNSDYFLKKIELLIVNGITDFVFDMTRVESVAAVGIGSFILIVKKVRKYKGSISIKYLSDQVFEIFLLPGFRDYFNIDADTNSLFLKQ